MGGGQYKVKIQAGMKGSSFLFMFISLWTGIAFAQGRDRPSPFSLLQPGVLVQKDLAYVLNGHDRQKLDLYVPENPERPFPLIV